MEKFSYLSNIILRMTHLIIMKHIDTVICIDYYVFIQFAKGTYVYNDFNV